MPLAEGGGGWGNSKVDGLSGFFAIVSIAPPFLLWPSSMQKHRTVGIRLRVGFKASTSAGAYLSCRWLRPDDNTKKELAICLFRTP